MATAAMFGLFSPPQVLTASTLYTVPPELLCSGEFTEWTSGTPNAAGLFTPKVFLEGPQVDDDGNLYFVDVPYGRIMHLHLDTMVCRQLAKWDGEPNGLVLSRCGKTKGGLIVADYKNGLMFVDVSTGAVSPYLTRRNLERFKGPNDLIEASNGDIFFTDQGQTGLHDPTGRVYRYTPSSGRLECLISNGPSPNGLMLSPDERVLYVAMTRDNSVWRCPIQSDGGLTKVGRFFQAFGSSGPDGLAVDTEGNLFICHPSMGCIFVVTPRGFPLAVIKSGTTGFNLTNCTFGKRQSDRRTLYITDSAIGVIQTVEWKFEGHTVD